MAENRHQKARGAKLRWPASLVIVLVSAVGFLTLLLTDDLAASGSSLSDLSSSGAFLEPDAEAGTELGLDRLTYLADGESVVIPNGGVVPLGDLELEVVISPYPPTNFDLTVDLAPRTVQGEALSDAKITADWDMTVMQHGPFETAFDNRGDGTFTAFFDLFMVGPWLLDLSVEAPGVPPSEVSLIIYVWPE